ncbi:MAG: tyrosine-protein phosphatase [Pontiellaceae bacterium]|nr:tyrosine-protein phosphatase [Pontiellaceae bacterium]MBN2785266.1 tyrosine-protein phosphatase [Pontiellaceae bacterium]
MKPACLFIISVMLTLQAHAQSSNRPASWAIPVELEGAPNLHKISDTLYRSAQPDKAGMKNLQTAGIKMIANLRSFSSDREEIGDTELGYEHIFMKAWHPERKEVVRFLKIVSNPANQPVLVHCKHGADRTGTMCAIYRVAIQGWTKEEAIREMTEGGYGFHKIWSNLPKWIDELDIDALRKEVGIASSVPES